MLKSRFFFPGAFLLLVSLILSNGTSAQDNSPYSRYGIGNEFPKTNIINRGMGGVSAAYNDIFSVNFNNPASYAYFQSVIEQRSKKMSTGRVVLDVGVNIQSRSLTTPNTPKSFTSSDALISHLFVGLPIRRNWGISFGIRPLNRISYNIFRNERLKDPITNKPIDSVFTQFTGSGGSFLPTIGTGFGTNNFSIGINIGYLFGKKELTTRRLFINDSVTYAASNHTNNTSFGDLFINGGVQYKIDLNKNTKLNLGLSGNLKQTINASQDLLRQTYTRNVNGEELRIDSVFSQADIKGTMVYPASYTVGFIVDRLAGESTRGWNFGTDFTQNKWEQYRFFGAKDSVRNNWEIHVGGQLTPLNKPTRYGQAVSYRLGFFAGQDYIQIGNKIPVVGITAGLGLPIVNYNRLSPNQYSILNLSMEYSRRGNDQNVLKENMFRLSVGFNFTDLWFGKRKYE